MGNLSYLSLEDQAMLCMIEKYVKFRQGSFWRQTKQDFEDEGMRPTAADRERLSSGIELSEHLALAVREAQRLVLDRNMESIKQVESKFFEGMTAQVQLEKVGKRHGDGEAVGGSAVDGLVMMRSHWNHV